MPHHRGLPPQGSCPHDAPPDGLEEEDAHYYCDDQEWGDEQGE